MMEYNRKIGFLDRIANFSPSLLKEKTFQFKMFRAYLNMKAIS